MMTMMLAADAVLDSISYASADLMKGSEVIFKVSKNMRPPVDSMAGGARGKT
eukprot:COSAG06_NODE_52627_length_304_cov_1.263415_2_plen_51_part_01